MKKEVSKMLAWYAFVLIIEENIQLVFNAHLIVASLCAHVNYLAESHCNS